MKYYLKIFTLSFICFSLMFGTGLFAYLMSIDTVSNLDISDLQNGIELAAIEKIVLTDGGVIKPDMEAEAPIQEDEYTELEQLQLESRRVNFLVFGHDGGRADTIIFVSYDMDKKLLDMINIPRDTYNKVAGHDRADHMKINSVYGYGDADGGSLGLKAQVGKLLGVTVHNYVKLSYKGVEGIIDSLGGIEVEVPFDMIYDDPIADPPLHIDIKAGLQILDGENSVDYLRWRKNNGESGDGDLPRIRRQQEFIKRVIKKSLSFKLPTVTKTVFNYVRTDIELDELLRITSSLSSGFDIDNLNTYSLPGSADMRNGSSYFFHDSEATEELMVEIYKRDSE